MQQRDSCSQSQKKTGGLLSGEDKTEGRWARGVPSTDGARGTILKTGRASSWNELFNAELFPVTFSQSVLAFTLSGELDQL